MISFRNTEKFDKDATIIFIDKEQIKNKEFAFKNKNVEEGLKELVKADRFSGEKDEVFPLDVKKSGLVLFVGLGKAEDLSPTALRITVKKAIGSSFLKKAEEIELIPHNDDEKTVIAVIEGYLIGTYKWDKYKSKPKDDKGKELKEVFLVAPDKKEFSDAALVCEGAVSYTHLV